MELGHAVFEGFGDIAYEILAALKKVFFDKYSHLGMCLFSEHQLMSGSSKVPRSGAKAGGCVYCRAGYRYRVVRHAPSMYTKL